MADHAILWDRDCGFCKRSLHRVLARDRDGRLRGVEIQSEEGGRLLAAIPEAERLDSWHLVEPDGTIHSAGAAAAPLARLLPRWRWAATAFERFPGATERAYGLVAANRDRLGKLLALPLLVLAMVGFGACGSDAGADASLNVYYSAGTGPRADDAVAGATLALERAGGEAGGVPVELVVLDGSEANGAADPEADDSADADDGSTASGSELTPSLVGERARTATEDSTSIAYIGEAGAATTLFSVPVTNEAGLLQIVPAPIGDDLVRDSAGSSAVPPRIQTTGERTLGAIASADAVLPPIPAGGEGREIQRELGLPGSREALYGYEAMAVVLDSIDRAADPIDRNLVVDAYLETTDRDSVLGTYSVDQVGVAAYADQR